MKRFLLGLGVCCAVGCGSLHADYVKKDRATYVGMAPVISAALVQMGASTLEGRATVLLYSSWDGRLDAAEEKIRKQGDQ